MPSPNPLSTHTLDPSAPDHITDIMARRESDPAALEPLPDALLAQLIEATEKLEQLQREKAAALAKAAAAEKASRESLARARAAEATQKSLLAKKDTFTRLFIKSLPHPCVSLETDPASGRVVAHISVILNDVPDASTYNGRTTHIAGETILLDCIPWQVHTKSGIIPVRLKGSVRLSLSKDSSVDYTQTQLTGRVHTQAWSADEDPETSEKSRETPFIPSHEALDTTANTTGSYAAPSAHDSLQSRAVALDDAVHTHRTRITKSLTSAPPSVQQAALMAALAAVTPRPLGS